MGQRWDKEQRRDQEARGGPGEQNRAGMGDRKGDRRHSISLSDGDGLDDRGTLVEHSGELRSRDTRMKEGRE